MLEISTEVFSIDITAVKDWNVELKALRADQKDGATAMKQNSQILKNNKSRYQSALKDLKDAGVEGKEFDIVLAHIDDAEKILTKELKQKIKDTRKGIVYPGWDSPFDLAVNLHKNMVDKFKDFQRYSKSAKKKGGSWYEQYLTDIAHDVADIKKDFDKRLARAIAQGPVPISESVLPVLGGATINARWPLPIGQIKSIILVLKSLRLSSLSTSSLSLWSGYSGVKLSNLTLWPALSGVSKLTSITLSRAKYLSPDFGALICPVTVSPVFKLNLLIWLGETYISSGPAV